MPIEGHALIAITPQPNRTIMLPKIISRFNRKTSFCCARYTHPCRPGRGRFSFRSRVPVSFRAGAGRGGAGGFRVPTGAPYSLCHTGLRKHFEGLPLTLFLPSSLISSRTINKARTMTNGSAAHDAFFLGGIGENTVFRVVVWAFLCSVGVRYCQGQEKRFFHFIPPLLVVYQLWSALGSLVHQPIIDDMSRSRRTTFQPVRSRSR